MRYVKTTLDVTTEDSGQKPENETATSSGCNDEDITVSSSLGVGDVMYDMTATTPSGVSYTISELLKGKNMVTLNF